MHVILVWRGKESGFADFGEYTANKDVGKIMDAIAEYRRVKKHQDDELYLASLLKGASHSKRQTTSIC